MTRKLQVACSGLGRMGARHAINLHNRTPRADLVAVFTPDPNEAAWASVNLPDIKVYDDFDEMLKHSGLEAVIISTITAVHTEQAIKAKSDTQVSDTPWFPTPLKTRYERAPHHASRLRACSLRAALTAVFGGDALRS